MAIHPLTLIVFVCTLAGLDSGCGSGTNAPPSKSNGTGIEAHNAWALEVSLDVEWAHSIAPGANILLVRIEDDVA